MTNIYVLSKEGEPLMPCHSYKKAKRLLKEKKAYVVQTRPFTIRLTYDIKDPVIAECLMGIDPGRTNIGVCVIDEEGRVLFATDVVTRNKAIAKYLEGRKKARQASRRGERYAKQRRAIKADKTGMAKATESYRMLPGCSKPVCCKVIRNKEAKFNHRKRPIGWLTPTARHLLLTHENVVKLVMKIVPVSAIVIEANRFDFARMENPGIRNWEYQKGRLYGFKDRNEAISYQQKGMCLLCGCEKIEHYHHLIPKSLGGSDTMENIAGLCLKCHDKVHKKIGAKKKLAKQKTGILKKYGALSVLNQIMPYLLDNLASQYDIAITTGYDTKRIREHYSLGKGHYIDAWCIAMSAKLDVDNLPEGKPAVQPDFEKTVFTIRQFRRHDRQRMKAQQERTYYLGKKAVCKNRHMRTGQADAKDGKKTWISLAEFRQANPKLVSYLTVKASKRPYNNMDRVLPGAVFMYEGKRYVLTSQQRCGTCWHAAGLPKNGVSASKCQVIAHNTGLVFI